MQIYLNNVCESLLSIIFGADKKKTQSFEQETNKHTNNN